MEQGKINIDELWNVNIKRMGRYMRKFTPFLNISTNDICIDIGDCNPKIKYIKSELGIEVEQVCDIDFNFDSFSDYYNHADIIFALEVVEHLQNPLYFMSELSKCLKENGSIYVTMPCNPKWLWVDGHYNEISRNRFDKWILNPLGLKIERYKRIYFVHNWSGLFIGFRPLIRVFKGEEHWKSLLRTILYFKYDIYEIKKINI